MNVRTITLEKVEEFGRFDGDVDAWARSSRRSLSDEEWASIERVIADSIVVAKSLVSKEYLAAHEARLNSLCDGPDTVGAIHRLAKRLTR
jgi:hypothetical protein